MKKALVCLSEGTRSRLGELDASTPVPFVALYSDVIVGVCMTETPPSNLLLPGGLRWDKSYGLTAGQLVAREQTAPPDAIALRACARLTASPEKLADKAAALFANTSILTIDGTVLTEGSTAADVIHTATMDAKVEHACVVRAYRTTSRGTPDVKPVAPVFHTYDKYVNVIVDAIAYVPISASMGDMCGALSEATARVAPAVFATSRACYSVACARHFIVLGGRLAVTFVADREAETGASAVASRAAIHGALMLPTDRPRFRAACQAYSKNAEICLDGGFPGRLSNVHTGLKPPAVDSNDAATSIHLVSGSYLYCHYLQDKFNDKGWGCAYRSLQTLLSWCVDQHYVTFKNGVLPSILDIQRALVEVGDKPAGFIGSREWIGANEVCYALDKFTGVESKILHVSSGSEMMSKSRVLAAHFDKQGSPVMVGGGLLAWTILGVAWNNCTGKSKFLILDPHYEGRDDLRVIQNKGWIGWKGDDIFKATAFYNLCMPQRPKGI